MYQPVPSSVDFPALEHEILELWTNIRAFEKLMEQLRGNPTFSFIDGPITANNPMGVHHAWGRTYKDIIQRYKAMQGFDQRWQNGFDCQGLWVEVEVEKAMGFNSKREIEAYGLAEFAKRCRERVEQYADVITQQSIRLGQWMRWDDSYYTFTDDNIQHIWHFLRTCHERGWLYKGSRSMPWCVRCGTGLSQHELVGTDSYRDVTHPSIYLRLPVEGREHEYFLVWTTTPWTLTANVALAVNPELEYARVRQGEDTYILSPRTVGFLEGEYEQVGTLRGAEMIGWGYRGPFDELPAAASVKHRVIPWSDVGEEEGTGIVHIAPGCGAEDFELSKIEGLDVIVPINEAGDYLPGFGDFTGQDVRGVREQVFANLRGKGLVYTIQDYTHRYPSCWRCGQELFFRLADEWFISAQEIREPMKRAAAEDVEWVPESAGKRMQDWLNNMGDWNISRKRYWGLPLPFYPCESCGTLTVIGTLAELRERAVSGLDQLQELHRPWIDEVRISCASCGHEVQRIPEVGDAWLDAGIVPFSTLHYLDDPAYWQKWFPAHFITEMREQIRLWFYSMLFMSVTLKDTAPYRRVLAYEKLMDESGKPMHKSLGNAIWFDEAAEKMGADVMRWLYAGQNIQANLNFGYGPAEDVKRKLLVLWNVYSFFVTYARLDGYVPSDEGIEPAKLRLIDRWILSRFQAVVEGTHAGLDALNPPDVTRLVDGFVDDLSTWYVRRSRRRFWKSESDADKQAAYATLYACLSGLSRVLAPFLPFLSESMYQNLVRSVRSDLPESVHHTAFPVSQPELRDEALERLVDQVRQVVSLGRAVRSQVGIRVRQPLARVSVAVPSGSGELAEELRREIAEELNVKEIDWGADLGSMVRTVARPNPAILGPRFGKEFPKILAALRAGELTVLPDGGVEVLGHRLEPDSVAVSVEPMEGFAAASDNGITVALDTELSPELIAEGRARELVHRIQTMRKDAGFNVEDRIVTSYDPASELASVMSTYEGYIRQETLSERLEADGLDGGFRWDGAIDGLPIRLAVRRVGT